MKVSGSSDAAVVEFAEKVQRMAKVHQYGLNDKPGPKRKPVQYPARQLLGFTQGDERFIDELLIKYLIVDI